MMAQVAPVLYKHHTKLNINYTAQVETNFQKSLFLIANQTFGLPKQYNNYQSGSSDSLFPIGEERKIKLKSVFILFLE